MGITTVQVDVSGPTGTARKLTLLVDSGATLSIIPDPVWRQLGLKPKRRAVFVLADGTQVTRPVSEAHFRFGEVESHSPVILGEPGDEPLMGVITLESLGVVLDPFKRELRPMKMRL
ncbi:MAG: aspartyl protease [Spirochaetes bacterium]|nr:aspartyl protease [Spirochaetota bacterium]